MLDFLYNIDLAIFYFFNHTIANPVFDKFFIYLTDVKNWYLVYIILLGTAFFKGGRLGKLSVLGALLLIAVSDQISSTFVKHLVERIRPCNALDDVRIVISCSGSFSFPSSHAVNNFAAAFFFYKIFPNLKYPLFITATLIAISRPYIGVHYPSDIVAGALLGIALGWVFGHLTLLLNKKFEARTNI